MKHRYFSTIFIALLLFGHAHSQSFTWIDGEETGYNMNPVMVNYTVNTSTDGSIWFAGLKLKKTNYTEMMGDHFLIQYDANGTRMNEHLINGTLVIYAIETDEYGNLFISGNFLEEDIVFWDNTVISWDGNSLNGFVAKILANGTVDWAINLNEEFGTFSSISDLLYFDESLYMAHANWPDSYVSKVEQNGSVSQIIVQTGVGIVSGIDFDSQGNLYLTGSCSGESSLFNGVNFPSPFDYNKHLVKYDPQGNPLWVRFVEDVTCISAQLKVDQDDHIYWAGPLSIMCTFDSINLMGPSWVYDFYLTRFSPDGNIQWAKEVPQVVTGDATIGKLESLSIMPDNSITFGGFTRGYLDWGNGITTDATDNSYNVLIMNFDKFGNIQWAKTSEGSSWETTNSLDIDESGNVYLVGVANDTTHFDELSYYLETFYYPFIVKLETESVGISLQANQTSNPWIVPNPVIDQLKISFPSNNIEHVKVFSSTGQLIHQFEKKNTFPVPFLVPGIYFVRIELIDGQILTNKMVKY